MSVFAATTPVVTIGFTATRLLTSRYTRNVKNAAMTKAIESIVSSLRFICGLFELATRQLRLSVPRGNRRAQRT
jgi:hypothetical protein